MKDFLFNIPTKIIFGKGKISTLEKQIPAKANKILIVTDPVIFEKTDIIEKVKSSLKNYEPIIFKDINENPTINSIDNGGNVAHKNSIDLVIGVGGGSAMDAAKGIAITATSPGSIFDYISGVPLKNNPLPIICIPTTSGTGSEVTPFAVFTDPDNQNKIGFANDSIFPVFSIVDPELTFSMPKHVTVNTGLDSLSHAIEAYLSTECSYPIGQLALHSLDIVLDNLYKASQNDHSAMEIMAYSSTISGIAIAHASTILPHIMGYPLTVFHDVPHGRASSIMLPAFLDYIRQNSTVIEKTKILEEKFRRKGGIHKFFEGLGVSTKLADYGVKESELKTFASKTIVKSDVSITPAKITEEVIDDLYKSMF